MSDITTDDQNFWNAVYSVFFLAVCASLFYTLILVNGTVPRSIGMFDTVLVVLATFRLTRLFVYDKITRFVRDFFFHADEEYTEEGVTYFIKKERTTGPFRTAYDLLTCPWCFSVWASVIVLFFYFLTPYAWFPIAVLAISGIASIVQLIANMIGWNAENGKLQATGKN